MLSLEIGDLMHLARQELCSLSDHLEVILGELEPGTVARLQALISLQNIRRAMLLRGFSF